jgi:hypothetical protein
MRKISIVTLALALASVGGSASAIYRTSDDLTGCGTMLGCEITAATANDVWGDAPGEDVVIMDGPVMVKDGGELTILPGVTVRGQPRYAPVSTGSVRGTPGVMVVTQSGEINAVGTCDADGVIIFTTAALDNDGDGVADDLDGNGDLDQYPGFAAACTSGAVPEGPDNIFGGTGAADDQMGTCSYGPGTFLDATPRTAPLAPLNANGESNLSLWGGFVLLGHAPTNLDGSQNSAGTLGVGLVEGFVPLGYREIDLLYGGVQPHDTSGSVECVSLRHGGDEVGEANELNGFTIGGQGDGTSFRYNEVYANFDDGFEWFGGTINTDHLVVSYVGDDSLDVDQGYTGVNQFSLSISPHFNQHDGNFFGSRSGDKAGEWDGEDCPNCNLAGMDSLSPLGTCPAAAQYTTPAPWPTSSAFFYNYTVMGNSTAGMGTPDFLPNAVCSGAGAPLACCTGVGTGTCQASDNEGVEMRNGFGGELRNSIVVNTGTEEAFDISGGGATCWTAPDNVCANHDLSTNPEGDIIRVVASSFHDSTIPPAGGSYCAGPDYERDALANGDAVTGAGPATGNIIGSPFAGLANEDTTFDPQGVGGVLVPALKTSPINPRPASPLGFGGGISPGSHPVADPFVTFRGAFGITENPLWTTGWTVLSIGGLLSN